jgi:hypothetical protein
VEGQGWRVDVEVVESAAQGISRSVRDQDNFELRGLCGDAELYGHDAVHGALMNFSVRWSDGMDALADDAQEISDALVRVAEAYRAVDEAAARGILDPAADVVDS